MSAPLLDIRGLSVRRGRRPVITGVRFSAQAGERIAVIGPNGAGKSTLLAGLALLLPVAGHLALGGRVLAAGPERARQMAYLPQETAFHWPMRTRDVVALGRVPHGWRGDELAPADARAVTRALAETGLEAFAERPVDALSGGERARVALARVLAVEAQVILADEPVAALDPRHQQETMTALARRAEEGALVLAVLHDLTLAARWASRVLLVQAGAIVADGPVAEVMTPARLADAFGIGFSVQGAGETRVVLPDLHPR